jgi:hypothetical protein
MPDAPAVDSWSLWLVSGVPVWITLATMLLAALMQRVRLLQALRVLVARRYQRVTDPAWRLRHWHPAVVGAERLLAQMVLGAVLVVLLASRLAPLELALVLSGPTAALVAWAGLLLAERRYVADIDRRLPGAVLRLGIQLRAGQTLARALQAIAADLEDGPLADEWRVLSALWSAPASSVESLTPSGALAFVAARTPSLRHRTLLGALAMVIDAPHTRIVRQVEAAGAALEAAERRRGTIVTELAQMRYSGIVVTMAGMAMVVYLVATQGERVARAYAGPGGALIGVVLAMVLCAPTVLGVWMARVEDAMY